MSGGKGIFIRGFHQVTKNELKEFFEEFGDIEEIILNKWQNYAIIEFQERTSADYVLSQEIFLKGQKLKIVRRKPQYPHQKEVKAVTNHPNDKAAEASKKDEVGSLAAALSFNSFDSQIMKFVQEMEAIDIKRKVEILCLSLQKAMRPCFPGCKIISFGSSVTGLASKESDVDIYIDIGDWKWNECEYSQSDLVMLSKNILRRNYEFTKCISIPKARVPILKCFHQITQLNCDINFQNALGIFNSQLIRFLLSLDSNIRVLIMFIKYWAKENHLCGHGSFTSYALVMLFIFYIQQIPNSAIPTVEVLQRNCKSHNEVQGWDCRFDSDPSNYPRSRSKKSLIEILGGFFNFYANFEFEKNVIIMNYGALVPKDHFKNTPENSLCSKYKLALQQKNADPIELKKVMCVLDPFSLNHNITASVGLRVMNRFQIRCFKSAEVCQKIESGDGGFTLQTIVGLQQQQKKIKFPYLESWKDNCVKLTLPLKGFSPTNLFETKESEFNYSNLSGMVEVLIFQLKEMFEKVLKLSVVKEEIKEIPVNSCRRKVAKMERMEDVHGQGESKILREVKLHLSGCFHVWNGRGPAFKEFSFPDEMKYIEKEMHVTNYIVDTFYQGLQTKHHKVDVNCIFVPIMDYRCLEVEITLCNPNDTFKPMIGYLLTILNKVFKE